MLRRARSVASLVALTTFLWALVPGTRALAQGREIPFMVQTVPKLPGIRFSLNGHIFTSDKHGLTLTGVSNPETYQLEVLQPSNSRQKPAFALRLGPTAIGVWFGASR